MPFPDIDIKLDGHLVVCDAAHCSAMSRRRLLRNITNHLLWLV